MKSLTLEEIEELEGVFTGGKTAQLIAMAKMAIEAREIIKILCTTDADDALENAAEWLYKFEGAGK